ncbi:MAG: pyridoxine 5-phosphate synthase [Flavobacteriales bacterium]|jgi:pyridoxine 5-phosphate synthase|tara:strand:+ start:40 stop:774 length:735 start_codon:yes stop_codon:yes gene_type:complete
MTVLSVNINKIATLRNSRGGDVPNLIKVAKDCERFGAQGITVHPRPDERHIRYQDVRDLNPLLSTEFNIEGYPGDGFVELVKENKPAQVTLVPDPPEAITSNAGWDVKKNFELLSEVTKEFQNEGIRVSIFVDPILEQIEWVKKTGADRIELYTEQFAHEFSKGNLDSVLPYKKAAVFAKEIGLGVNAGHDLSLENLNYFAKQIPALAEVSIGHALIADALYLGLENTIQLYKRALNTDNGIEF